MEITLVKYQFINVFSEIIRKKFVYQNLYLELIGKKMQNELNRKI